MADLAEDMAEDSAVAAGINKFQSDTHLLRALTSTKLCCTKSRKFFFNKKTSEEAADMAAAVMEEVRQNLLAAQKSLKRKYLS